jgi:hypothetical protein
MSGQFVSIHPRSDSSPRRPLGSFSAHFVKGRVLIHQPSTEPHDLDGYRPWPAELLAQRLGVWGQIRAGVWLEVT